MTRVVVCLALSVVFGASLGFLATRSIAAAQSPGSFDAPARPSPSRPLSLPVRPLTAGLVLKADEPFIAVRTRAEDNQPDAASTRTGVAGAPVRIVAL